MVTETPAQSRPNVVRRHAPATVTALLFLVGRIVLFAGGLRFTTHTTADLALLDPAQLARDPFLAFTANHVQPPLWNFFVGVVLRWTPFPTGGTFQVLFVAAGLATVVALRSLLSHLGTTDPVSVVAATLVGWSPVLIGYESMLTYETPVTLVVTLSAWSFARYVRRPDTAHLAVFAGFLVVGVLLRTTLTPVWLIGGLGIVLLARGRPPRTRRKLGVVAVAVALVAVPLLHRSVSFGVAGFSSYSGMNLARTTTMQWPESSVDEMISERRISPAARVIPFSVYLDYLPYFPPCRPHEGKVVLDQFFKSDGTNNLNNVCFIPVSRQSLRDAVRVVQTDPGRYVSLVGTSTMLYASWEVPGTLPEGFPDHWAASGLLKNWTSVYRPLALPVHVDHTWDGGGDPQPSLRTVVAAYAKPLERTDFSITVAVGLLVAIVLGVRGVWRWIRRRSDDRDLIRVYLGFTVVSVGVVSVAFDTFENARFRAPLDPIVLGPLFALVLTGASRVVSAVVRHRSAARPAR